MMHPPPPPELRSPAEPVGGLVYFGRMVDKIRLHLQDRLPAELRANLGLGFDARCAHFLRISYPALVDRVRDGGDDEELLDWCFAHGRHPDDDETEIYNAFMCKRGWKDGTSPKLAERKRESGLEGRNDVLTMFQYLDADEGRPVRAVEEMIGGADPAR